jgi:hypothetical protein
MDIYRPKKLEEIYVELLEKKARDSCADRHTR